MGRSKKANRRRMGSGDVAEAKAFNVIALALETLTMEQAIQTIRKVVRLLQFAAFLDTGLDLSTVLRKIAAREFDLVDERAPKRRKRK